MPFLPPNQQYCVQYTLRANRMIQDVNSVFSPDQPCWTSALNYYSVASVSPDHTSAVPRPIYKSSVWWTSKEAYETSRNRLSVCGFRGAAARHRHPSNRMCFRFPRLTTSEPICAISTGLVAVTSRTDLPTLRFYRRFITMRLSEIRSHRETRFPYNWKKNPQRKLL